MRDYLQKNFFRSDVTWRDYLISLMLALGATGIIYLLEEITVERFSNINSTLIISVLISAIFLGRAPAILNAIVCVYMYEWLMVPPFFEANYGLDNIIKFSVFVFAAIITGWIAGMAKNYAIALKKREVELIETIKEKERYKNEKEQEVIKREAEVLRNAVLASVSHDLKTPLASIIGAISSFKLYSKEISEQDRSELIDSVLGEANKLHGYVNNILEVAKLEEHNTILRKDIIAVDDVIDLIIKRFSNQLRNHKIKINQDTDLYFMGDEHLMDIAIGNIIDNAIKFSPENTKIIISYRCSTSTNKIVIEIEDEGVGVNPEDKEKIFDKFYRSSMSDYKNTGTGLGLWISRKIIDAHLGTIEIENKDKTKKSGARVRITLPKVDINIVEPNNFSDMRAM